MPGTRGTSLAFTVKRFHYNNGGQEGHKCPHNRGIFTVCVIVTSWVVHMHEEHIFITVQDGIKLQANTPLIFFLRHSCARKLSDRTTCEEVTPELGNVEKGNVATGTN